MATSTTLQQIKGPFYIDEGAAKTGSPAFQHAVARARLLLERASDPFPDAPATIDRNLTRRIRGPFYIHRGAVDDRESESEALPPIVQQIGSQLLQMLISEILQLLTSSRAVEWEIENELTTDNLSMQLVGTVTNLTEGSGTWVEGDSPANSIPADDEEVLGTASNGAGAIGMVAYSFKLKGKEQGYGYVVMLAACPKSTHNGVNGQITFTTSPPAPTQSDLDALFDTLYDGRRDSFSSTFSEGGSTYTLQGASSGNDVVTATFSITQTTD